MGNSGGKTDTSNLYVRQIGNIVSIQGKIHTANANNGNWGGVIAVIPNQIDPPKYSVKTCFSEVNGDTKYNRGVEFYIKGGSRNVQLNESGYVRDTELNFTYMV